MTDRRFDHSSRRWVSIYEILPDGRQGRLMGLLRPNLSSNYQDVHAFHRKFGLEPPPAPRLLDQDTLEFRLKFMHEELQEFVNACVADELAEAADALVDLVYVALGTAVLMGLPWQELWDEVQSANLAKERATSPEQSKRGSALDVVKPAGWRPPDLRKIIDRYLTPNQKEEPTDEDPVHGHQRPPRQL